MGFINFRGKVIHYVGRPDWWAHVESGQWEPSTFDVLDRFIKQGKTLLDIGAWNGICSIYAKMNRGNIYSVEPDPVALEELRLNFEVNKILSPVFNVAISNHTGYADISNEHNALGNSNTSLLSRYDNEDKVHVRSYTLEDFLLTNAHIIPDLIKIDTEGSEALIIPSSVEVLKRCNCPLYLSLHPYWLTEEQIKDIWAALGEVYDIAKMEIFDTANKEILLLPK